MMWWRRWWWRRSSVPIVRLEEPAVAKAGLHEE
jgi:hypothetical protein